MTGVCILDRVHPDSSIENRAATLRLSISSDGRTWQEVWQADQAAAQWEIPVTDFVAGAQVPGRDARYLRLELTAAKPEVLHLRQVEVWGKERP